MLKRKAYKKLVEWKQKDSGTTTLLIEGARRVGKSTLVREFGKNEYASCLFIDFFQAPQGARMRSYEEAFFWLSDARIANLCFACDDPSVGLALSKDDSSLKCYMADTGLLVTMAFGSSVTLDEDIYRTILRGNIGINEGMLTENIISQMLVANGHKLFFLFSIR